MPSAPRHATRQVPRQVRPELERDLSRSPSLGYEPAEDVLRDRFVDASTDPRRMALLADEETREVRDRWLESVEKRYAVEWKRDPR